MPKIVDHDSRRQAYVDAMWRVVSREGAGGISVRSVAAEAGVSPSNIVHYLPSRGEMLGEAVSRLVADASARAAELEDADLDLDSATDLVMVAIPHTRTRRRQSEVWLLLLAEQETNPDARRILSGLQGRVAAAVRRSMDRFAAAGLMAPTRDRDREAVRLHALIDGLSIQALVSSTDMSPTRIRETVRIHLADLANDPD
jgi:AcrR family transcriptional regulator